MIALEMDNVIMTQVCVLVIKILLALIVNNNFYYVKITVLVTGFVISKQDNVNVMQIG
jgi:hypothetical protein